MFLTIITVIIVGVVFGQKNSDNKTALAAALHDSNIENVSMDEQLNPLVGQPLKINNINGRESANVDDSDDATPYHKVSNNPTKFFGIYWTSGYKIQPYSKFTFLNHNVTFYAQPTLTLADGAWANGTGRIYVTNWYVSSNHGESWSKIDKKDNNYSLSNGNLTVPGNEIGKKWFQCAYEATTWIPLVGYVVDKNISFYSNVVTLTTYQKPIPATKVNVRSEDEYLYNTFSDSTTMMNSELEPKNSTAQFVNWLVDDPSLATVDPNTGELTANSNGKDGFVTVTANYLNIFPDVDSTGKYLQSNISGTHKVEIGGGLNDRTTDVEKPVTFNILGIDGEAEEEQPDSVEWFKSNSSTATGTSIAKGTWDQMKSYTIKYPQPNDDGTYYYAEMTKTEKDSDGKPRVDKFHTRHAKLSVNYNHDPVYKISSKIYDDTWPHDNANNHTQINNVAGPDKIRIEGQFQNTNKYGKSSQLQMTIDIPYVSRNYIVTVKVDGKDANKTVDYTTAGNNRTRVTIKNLNGTDATVHNYEIGYISASDVQGQSEKFAPEISGTTNSNDTLSSLTESSNYLTINYANNDLSASASDIDFGDIHFVYDGLQVKGKTNDDNPLTIRDRRSRKAAVKLELSSDGILKSTDSTLAANLYYDDGENNISHLTAENPVELISTNDGDIVPSIIWDKTKGLYLKFIGNSYKTGKYKTTLNWTFVDSIQ